MTAGDGRANTAGGMRNTAGDMRNIGGDMQNTAGHMRRTKEVAERELLEKAHPERPAARVRPGISSSMRRRRLL